MPVQTPSSTATHDPAHPDQENKDHTTTSGEKPKTAFQVITDPEFLPTLESVPKTQHIKSYLILMSLVVGGVVGAWFFGFDLFQTSSSQKPQIPFQAAHPQTSASSWIELLALLGFVVVALLCLIGWTGGLWIDWWELVLGYWWLTMPAAGAGALFLVMMQETASRMEDVA